MVSHLLSTFLHQVHGNAGSGNVFVVGHLSVKPASSNLPLEHPEYLLTGSRTCKALMDLDGSPLRSGETQHTFPGVTPASTEYAAISLYSQSLISTMTD
jgi:hypothetical protein